MGLIRKFLQGHYRLVAIIMALALCLKFAVPTGYMVDSAQDFLSLRICDGQTGGAALLVKVPMKGVSMHHGDDGDTASHAANHCPFATMAMSGLEASDVVLLLIALAFIMALGFAPLTTPDLRRIFYARPPLRGPPFSILHP
ncbi:hypothetical protein GRI39_09335 [Altererythrobacter indicus]|uniref:DUF2946 domain-containing protein n=1 Tax=Altericroceibacterium indicum TaxID=374177 RepID=A0A845A9P9_9SPHN|nr:DUF2946 family protein [Altericroceibacterium indicum]MXP26237.1 hypothetical protein [Altericroceibacterium indicum]